MTSKTDNHNLQAKVDLRLAMLATTAGPIRVFDACQGSGLIWKELRKTVIVESYWGVDLKPQKGRVKIDSARVLEQRGWNFSVVDCDTYGSPWRHWLAILANMPRELLVFLTIGKFRRPHSDHAGFQAIAHVEMDALGLGKFKRWQRMRVLFSPLTEISSEYCLGFAERKGIKIIEALEVENPGGNARYIGLRLRRMENMPKKNNSAPLEIH